MGKSIGRAKMAALRRFSENHWVDFNLIWVLVGKFAVSHRVCHDLLMRFDITITPRQVLDVVL